MACRIRSLSTAGMSLGLVLAERCVDVEGRTVYVLVITKLYVG